MLEVAFKMSLLITPGVPKGLWHVKLALSQHALINAVYLTCRVAQYLTTLPSKSWSRDSATVQYCHIRAHVNGPTCVWIMVWSNCDFRYLKKGQAEWRLWAGTTFIRWLSEDTEENSPCFFVPAYWNSKQGIPRTDQLVSTPTFWWKTAKLLNYIQITDNRFITVFGLTCGKTICQYWMDIKPTLLCFITKTGGLYAVGIFAEDHSDILRLDLLQRD